MKCPRNRVNSSVRAGIAQPLTGTDHALMAISGDFTIHTGPLALVCPLCVRQQSVVSELWGSLTGQDLPFAFCPHSGRSRLSAGSNRVVSPKRVSDVRSLAIDFRSSINQEFSGMRPRFAARPPRWFSNYTPISSWPVYHANWCRQTKLHRTLELRR